MSVRRRRFRRTLPAINSSSSTGASVSDGKPRAECSYDEIYPDLNVDKPLVLYFSSGEQWDGNNSVNADDIDGNSFSNGLIPGQARIKRKRRLQVEIWGTPDSKDGTGISRRTRSGSTNGSIINHNNTPDDFELRKSLHRQSSEKEAASAAHGAAHVASEQGDELDGVGYIANEDGDEELDVNRRQAFTISNSPLVTRDHSTSRHITATPTSTRTRTRNTVNEGSSRFRILPEQHLFSGGTANSNGNIDESLESLGYRQSDNFDIPDAYIRTFVSLDEPTLDSHEIGKDSKPMHNSSTSRHVRVEYDMDEQDEHFLNELNIRRQRMLASVNQPKRRKNPSPIISKEIFEITMTLLEIEWFKIEKKMPPKRKTIVENEISDADGEQKCVICDDSECDNSNAIVFCDGCDIAVHQDCYGVPFIPEGQWLCRQCSVSHRRRRRANCIFCPNKSGAFKQTDTQHWAHVLCALWIPETTVGNISYMEPICGLENIPKGRWKLNCYICKQKIGACIQCANKNCFQAFHPTCARKARLYMKMESGILGAIYDPGSTVSFCDRHSPDSYKEVVDVSAHVKAAQKHYAAANITQLPSTKKKILNKKTATVTTAWRTEEGAPIIPAVIVKVIGDIMEGFGIDGFSDFLIEVCRYWTLKRQMKKGAALIKRLQIALEAEPKRQNNDNLEELVQKLAAKEQVLRRIELLKIEIEQVLQREQIKLQRTEVQHSTMDLLYFPEARLIKRIWTDLKDMTKKIGKEDAVLVFNDPDDHQQKTIQQYISNRQYMSIEEFATAVDIILKEKQHICQDIDEHKGLDSVLKLMKWMQSKVQEAELVNANIRRDESTGLPDFRTFEPKGLEVQQEEWEGARLQKELSPMTEIDDDELTILEEQTREFESSINVSRSRKKRKVHRKR